MPAPTADRPSPEASITTPQYNNWIKLVEQHVAGLRFGSVEITVHEGRVVQIEVSTKVRFEKTH